MRNFQCLGETAICLYCKVGECPEGTLYQTDPTKWKDWVNQSHTLSLKTKIGTLIIIGTPEW